MIYLDNCATTRVDDDIIEAIGVSMRSDYGNPSSLHHFGMDAYRLVNDARSRIGNMIGAPTDSIIFTSSGTDSNNLAIFSSLQASDSGTKKIVTTAIEHSSVLQVMRQLEKQGYEITYVRPDPILKKIKAQDIIDAVDEDTVLLSFMHANNETGEILPAEEIIKGCREKNKDLIIHMDCVQSFAKIPVALHKLKADLISASGHKFHAPKGIGFLYIRPGLEMKKTSFGGAQEKGYRPGTENVPGMVGIGLACEKAMIDMRKNHEHVSSLNAFLREQLKRFETVSINSPDDALPYVLNISVAGRNSHDLINALGMKDIYLSQGAACNKNEKSHVLKAYGVDEETLNGALRISLSKYNTLEECETFIRELQNIIKGD